MNYKRFAKIFPRNDKLRRIIAEHGEYFEVVGAAEVQPALKNQLCLTLKDENITFTTSVTNLRIVQDWAGVQRTIKSHGGCITN